MKGLRWQHFFGYKHCAYIRGDTVQTTARWRTFADKSADLCPRIIRKAPHRIRADAVRTWIDFCGCGADMDLNFKIYADAVRTWLKCCGCGADADCVPQNSCPRTVRGLSADVDCVLRT